MLANFFEISWAAAIFLQVQTTTSHIKHCVTATYKPCMCKFAVVKEIANLLCVILRRNTKYTQGI